MNCWNCCALTTLTVKSISLWYVPHSSEHRPANVPVAVVVSWNWVGWPGTTSRLNRKAGTQNEWITAGEGRSNWMVSPNGGTRTGSRRGVATSCTLPRYAYGHSQLHWNP